MNRAMLPYMLLTAFAIFSLLVSQGIWIVGAVRQGSQDRQEVFQNSFDRAVSFSIFRRYSATPFLEMTPALTTEEEREASTAPRIDLGDINTYDNVGRMFEDALLLNQIQRGRIDLLYLDSLIQDRSSGLGLGYSISARLVLRDDMHNTTLDSIVHTQGRIRRLFSDKYITERVIVAPENQYTIRAEYRIAPQGRMLRMSIAIAVSVLASAVIVVALLLLARTLRRRHEELQEMQRMFHGAVHDLKSPLAHTYTSLIALEESMTDPQRKMSVEQAADGVLFLSEKIALMLRSSQNIKEVAKNEKEEVYLYDIVEQISAEIQALLPKKKIRFENTVDTDFSLSAAPNLLEATMRILMENAVRHNTSDTPTVAVTGVKDGNNVRITVADNGAGIPKRMLKDIFKPYYTSNKKEGMGIGLYYAHTIVKAHGGTLSAASEPGEGSVFTMVMPYRRNV